MTKTNKKSQTSNSKPKTSWKIIKAKQLVNSKLETRRSSRLYLHHQLKFGKLSVDLQSKISWEVLKNFNLNEQLKMRMISPAWDYNVQLAYKQVRSLVVNLPHNSNKKFTKFSTCIRNKFKTNIDENLKQSTQNNNKVELKIRAQQWDHSTNASLGKMFCNVDQLTIYYTMNNRNIKLLCDLLQKFPKVTSFSLIVLNQILKCNEHFINQLFSAINNHLAPLSSLHVYFDSRFTPTIDPNSLDKTLPFVQNLSLCFPVKNYHEIIAMIGKNQKSSRFPIQSLSLRATNLKITQISPMFGQNPALGKIKRLQLVDVESQELVDCLLDHFTELEYLEISLGSKLIDVNQYSVEWLKTLSKLSHLTELFLRGMYPQVFDSAVQLTPLSTVRRLTIDCLMPWENIIQDFEAAPDDLRPMEEQIYPLVINYLVNFTKQCPKIDELIVHDGPLKKLEDGQNYIKFLCKRTSGDWSLSDIND